MKASSIYYYSNPEYEDSGELLREKLLKNRKLLYVNNYPITGFLYTYITGRSTSTKNQRPAPCNTFLGEDGFIISLKDAHRQLHENSFNSFYLKLFIINYPVHPRKMFLENQALNLIYRDNIKSGESYDDNLLEVYNFSFGSDCPLDNTLNMDIIKIPYDNGIKPTCSFSGFCMYEFESDANLNNANGARNRPARFDVYHARSTNLGQRLINEENLKDSHLIERTSGLNYATERIHRTPGVAFVGMNGIIKL